MWRKVGAYTPLWSAYATLIPSQGCLYAVLSESSQAKKRNDHITYLIMAAIFFKIVSLGTYTAI
jgi:hypothetical protein